MGWWTILSGWKKKIYPIENAETNKICWNWNDFSVRRVHQSFAIFFLFFFFFLRPPYTASPILDNTCVNNFNILSENEKKKQILKLKTGFTTKPDQNVSDKPNLIKTMNSKQIFISFYLSKIHLFGFFVQALWRCPKGTLTRIQWTFRFNWIHNWREKLFIIILSKKILKIN